MFTSKYKICQLFGIPVYLSMTTICMLFFFVGMTGSIMMDLACMVMLLISIVAHELGHSLTARCFGCRTRDITLTVIGGCASLERIPHKAWQEFLTAAAGPLVSFAIGVAMFFVWLVLPQGSPWEFIPEYTCIINFTLGAFNLLPGFPMDGGRLFRSIARIFTSRVRATYLAMVVGRVFAILLVVGPFLGIDHIWIIPIGGSLMMRILIGVMIWFEGKREYQQALMEGEWGGRWDFYARVSPPPYGGDDDETEIRRDR